MAHLTDDEFERAFEMSKESGITMGASFVWPMAIVFVLALVVGPAILYAVTPIFLVAAWFLGKREHRKSKEFLCSTKWSRFQGISPDELKMFTFGG